MICQHFPDFNVNISVLINFVHAVDVDLSMTILRCTCFSQLPYDMKRPLLLRRLLYTVMLHADMFVDFENTMVNDFNDSIPCSEITLLNAFHEHVCIQGKLVRPSYSSLMNPLLDVN